MKAYVDSTALLEELPFSASTLLRLMKQGLPHHRLGRKYLFDRDAVFAWLAPRYALERVCAHPDCETRLSRYNPSDRCSVHG